MLKFVYDIGSCCTFLTCLLRVSVEANFFECSESFFPISWETNFIGKMFPTTSLKSPPSPPIISTLMQFLPFSIGASFPPLPFAAQIYGKNSTLSSRGIEARVRYQSCKRIKFWIFIYFSRKKCRGS